MLGKQRKNQVSDQQFMETAWENMVEILDQEMPIEKKESRVGWLSIAAILVAGFVGGISVMWGLQNGQSNQLAVNHSTESSDKVEMVNTDLYSQEKPVLAQINTKNNSKNLLNKTTTNTDSKNSARVLPDNSANQESIVSSNQNLPSSSYSTLKEISDEQKVLALDNPTVLLPTEGTFAVALIQQEGSDEKILIENQIPLNNLPTLGLEQLPTTNTDFSIDNDLDLPKNKKWRTGIYAGAIVAGKTGNGLEAGVRVERKLSPKWAIETGLGFRGTQFAFLNESVRYPLQVNSEDVSPIPIVTDPGPDGNFSGLNQESTNFVNANEANYQLTTPLSVVFRPTGKLRLALGMSWALRLNALKDASFLGSFNLDSSENDFDEYSFEDRLEDLRLNFGVGYQLNSRNGIESVSYTHLTLPTKA